MNKIVVVSEGTDGLGKSIAEKLILNNNKVIIISRDEKNFN